MPMPSTIGRSLSTSCAALFLEVFTVKPGRQNLRTITFRIDSDTASLIESIAAEMNWSTAKLVEQLIDRSVPELNRLKNQRDLGRLFAHLQRYD